MTNKDGYAEIKDIPQGTKVTITEVTAVNKDEVKTAVIEPNKTMEVGLDNKAQQGLLKLTKTGNKAVGVEHTESEYGDLYSFIFVKSKSLMRKEMLSNRSKNAWMI